MGGAAGAVTLLSLRTQKDYSTLTQEVQRPVKKNVLNFFFFNCSEWSSAVLTEAEMMAQAGVKKVLLRTSHERVIV